MKKLIPLLLLPLISAAAPTKTAQVTVAGYAGSSTLANFPVPVKISEAAVPGFLYADCAAGGADLSFADAAGNALPFEVDTWNASGTSVVWVLLPEVAPGGATTFTMGWSDPSPAGPSAAAVWTGASYKSVFHMNFSGANTTDSVAGIQGTILNANAYAGAGTGILGGDYRCEENKTAHNIKIAASAANAAGFSADTTSVATFSGWFRQIGGLSGNNTDYPQISWSKWGNCGVLWNTKNGQNNNTTAGIEAGVESAQKENGPYDQVRRFVLRDQKTNDSDAKHDCDSSTIQSFFDSQWHHVAICYDGTRATVYVDGVAQSAFNAERKFSNPGSGNVIRFGNRADSAPDCVWTGDLDEFRFRSAASSADWVAAEYASVATDGFLAFGAPGASSTILFY